MTDKQRAPKITEHTVNDEPINVWHPEVDGEGYCISYGPGGWMPGAYDTLKTALRGAEACFLNERRFVVEVQEPVNNAHKGDRLITEDDIRKFENRVMSHE